MEEYSAGVAVGQVKQEALLEDGFVVVRQVVPSARLEELRAAFEAIVTRQRAVWESERGPDDPSGGAWETSAQPRVSGFDRYVDEATAAAVEWCLDDGGPWEASQRIMQAPDVEPTAYTLPAASSAAPQATVLPPGPPIDCTYMPSPVLKSSLVWNIINLPREGSSTL